MSFQKAHQISNELAEVVVQTQEYIALNSAGTKDFVFQPLFKNYRVLELGVVSINSTTCTGAKVKFGITGGGDELVTDADAFDFTTGAAGEVHSTASSFNFNSGGSALDADGVPVLLKGQVLSFRSTGAAVGGTRVIAFARLAPIIEFKD